MGHEYIHSAFNFRGHLDINRQEAVAYKWSYDQAAKWNLSASGYKVMLDHYAPLNTKTWMMKAYSLSWIRDGFMNSLLKKPW